MIKLIHKRALSLLLSMALVFTVMPVTALAATEPSVSFLDSGNIEAQTEATVIDNGSTTLNSGWYVVNSGDVTIPQTVTVSGDVKLILADGANLTVNGTSGDNAGINVTQGNSLSIYAQSMGSSMGQLTATGNGNGAGIGCAEPDSSGTISIYGGMIMATGGDGNHYPSGIGNVCASLEGFGTIGIYGGKIIATNATLDSYPDIGGHASAGDEIFIKGGAIISNRRDSTVNLGNSNNAQGVMPKIVIDGGSFLGGNVISEPLTNSHGDAVSPFPDVLTVPGKANAAVSSVSINGETYGSSLFTDSSGDLYLHPRAYDSVVPVVVTMEDGSKYWGTYQPKADGFGCLLLVNTQNQLVYPNSAYSLQVLPQDITVYKYPGGTFSGIKNGSSTLTEGTDYTANGDAITIKADYLKTLPAGETDLFFTGLGDDSNSALSVSVAPAFENISLGDSIATGYGLPGYHQQAIPPLAISYPSIVGNALGLTTCSFASDSIPSTDLLSELADPRIKAYLSKTKVITLSIGSDDILGPFLETVAHQLGCSPDQIQLKLAALMQSDPATLAADLSALNADDGSGLKNNQILKNAAIRFQTNFQNIISAIKAAAPNAKLYVTNTYNPYEGISIPYGAGTLDLGAIADSYIQTLNSAFSTNSADYTLIDIHSSFSSSLKSGTSLVNANMSTGNFDPHPNAAGHMTIANMILAASGFAPTTQAVSTAIGSLSGMSTPNEVAGVVAQVLGLSFSDQSRIDAAQIARLESLMQSVLGVTPLNIPLPVTTGFSGSNALPPTSPTVTGLTLATYGEIGAALSTTQFPTPSNIPGAQFSFDLTLTESGSPLPVHSKLPFPVTVTVRLPSGFVPKAGYQYSIRHDLQGGSSEILSATIGGTAGNYTATFSTSSFSMFTLVETNSGSSSGGSSSGGSVSGGTAITFVSDTNADLSVDGTYQFKITSKNGMVPSLIVGTPGIFKTQLIRVSDENYYFKLTAIGKPGNCAGIYVNGTKLLVATIKSNAYFVSDTINDFAVNGTYQFKITSKDGKAPNFVAGTPGIFETKLVKHVGNDYFYKITATGKPGDCAGIYVDGTKLLVATVKSNAYFVSDTLSDFTVSNTYTFKITSKDGRAPSFVVGTPGVFAAKLFKHIGNDYFYMITVIGKSGDCAGIYVHGTRLLVATVK